MLNSALAGLVRAAGVVVALGYAVLLLPVLFIGFAAYSDYQNRGCPDAWQCGDALLTIKFTLAFVLAGPVTWFFFKGLRKFASSSRGAADA